MLAHDDGDEAQHLIAREVAIDVVEALEEIDVDDDQATGKRLVRRGLDHLAQTLLEMLAVRQPGEGIGEALQPRRLQRLAQGLDLAAALAHACFRACGYWR